MFSLRFPTGRQLADRCLVPIAMVRRVQCQMIRCQCTYNDKLPRRR